jgi:26S proteasome regulatory subunit T4
MFGYAKEHEPCIIFMDEIDAIGGRRFSEGTSADREIQRTLMELLNQLDGFDYLGKTKIIMATNRPDTLDPALLRAGRLDRKIEIPLPNEVGRLEILKIHAASVAKEGELDYESIVKMSDQLNGADLRNVITEAGFFAIREEREAINQEDMSKAVRKVAEAKKLEGKLGMLRYHSGIWFGRVLTVGERIPEIVMNWLCCRVVGTHRLSVIFPARICAVNNKIVASSLQTKLYQ